MFSIPTVFILGAGASWHYGYPTGEDLVPRVIAAARRLEAFFAYGAREQSGDIPAYALRNFPENAKRTIKIWKDAEAEAGQLALRLERVNPTLIDYFLAQNADLHDIGRLAIAIVIFECENAFHKYRGNPNHIVLHKRQVEQGGAFSPREPVVTAFSDDWLRFVLHSITVGCPNSAALQQNRVTFITFNYDMSLEKRLFEGLSHTAYFSKEDVSAFFDKNRIIHIYGQVRERIDAQWSPMETSLSTDRLHVATALLKELGR